MRRRPRGAGGHLEENWQFAAVVAAISLGLGGLLILTLIAIAGFLRMYQRGERNAAELADSIAGLRDLVPLRLGDEHAGQGTAGGAFQDLRARADALLEQQARLQTAIRSLVEAGVLSAEGSAPALTDIQASLGRLEEVTGQLAVAVANLSQRLERDHDA